MQSFIVNIPNEKRDFFLELVSQLGFEALSMDEQPSQPAKETELDTVENNAFLDWQEEQKILKIARRGKI